MLIFLIFEDLAWSLFLQIVIIRRKLKNFLKKKHLIPRFLHFSTLLMFLIFFFFFLGTNLGSEEIEQGK